MKKKMIALTLAMALTAASSVAVYAFTCDVVSVDGGKVVLDCKEKFAEKLEVGKKAKVTADKGKKGYEGC